MPVFEATRKSHLLRVQCSAIGWFAQSESKIRESEESLGALAVERIANRRYFAQPKI
jgi:hypothetical protein